MLCKLIVAIQAPQALWCVKVWHLVHIHQQLVGVPAHQDTEDEEQHATRPAQQGDCMREPQDACANLTGQGRTAADMTRRQNYYLLTQLYNYYSLSTRYAPMQLLLLQSLLLKGYSMRSALTMAVMLWYTTCQL
jgi:hypothetical protein